MAKIGGPYEVFCRLPITRFDQTYEAEGVRTPPEDINEARCPLCVRGAVSAFRVETQVPIISGALVFWLCLISVQHFGYPRCPINRGSFRLGYDIRQRKDDRKAAGIIFRETQTESAKNVAHRSLPDIFGAKMSIIVDESGIHLYGCPLPRRTSTFPLCCAPKGLSCW